MILNVLMEIDLISKLEMEPLSERWADIPTDDISFNDIWATETTFQRHSPIDLCFEQRNSGTVCGTKIYPSRMNWVRSGLDQHS